MSIPSQGLPPLQNLLRARLTQLLSPLDPTLSADVMQALQSRGKLLSVPSPAGAEGSFDLPAGIWSLFTFLLARHLSPEIQENVASSIAVSVECLVCAIDLLDDVADDDDTPVMRMLGRERVMISATALMALSGQAILSLKQQRGLTDERFLSLYELLLRFTQLCMAGQQQDILAEQQSTASFSAEECLAIVRAKSGSLMKLACLLGAVCAGATQQMCAQVENLGELLGIAHQLDNDCHDLYDLLMGTGNVKTDLKRGKKTLPIVIGAHTYAALQKSPLSVNQEETEEYRRCLREGMLAAWGICLHYRERVREDLHEFEAQTHPLELLFASLLAQVCERPLDREPSEQA